MSDFQQNRKKFEEHVTINMGESSGSRQRRISIGTLEWLNGKVESIRRKFSAAAHEQAALEKFQKTQERNFSAGDGDLIEMCQKYQVCCGNKYTWVLEPFESIVTGYGQLVRTGQIKIHKETFTCPRGVFLMPLSSSAGEALLDFSEMGGFSLGRGSRVAKNASRSLSRAHCMIYLENNRVLLKDCDSKTGTFINGKLLGSSVPTLLENFDIIQMGYGGNDDDFIQVMVIFLASWNAKEFIDSSENRQISLKSNHSRTFSNSVSTLMMDPIVSSPRLNEISGPVSSKRSEKDEQEIFVFEAPQSAKNPAEEVYKINSAVSDTEKFTNNFRSEARNQETATNVRTPKIEVNSNEPKVNVRTSHINVEPKETASNIHEPAINLATPIRENSNYINSTVSEISSHQTTVNMRSPVNFSKIHETIPPPLTKDPPPRRNQHVEEQIIPPLIQSNVSERQQQQQQQHREEEEQQQNDGQFKVYYHRSQGSSTLQTPKRQTQANLTSEKSPMSHNPNHLSPQQQPSPRPPPVPKPRKMKKGLSKSAECLIEMDMMELDLEESKAEEKMGNKAKVEVEKATPIKKSNATTVTVKMPIEAALAARKSSITPQQQPIVNIAIPEFLRAENLKIPATSPAQDLLMRARNRSDKNVESAVNGKRVDRIEKMRMKSQFTTVVQGVNTKRFEFILDFGSGTCDISDGLAIAQIGKRNSLQISFNNYRISWTAESLNVANGCKLSIVNEGNQYLLMAEGKIEGSKFKIASIDMNLNNLMTKVSFLIDDTVHKGITGKEIDPTQSLPLKALNQLTYFYPHLELPTITIQGAPESPENKLPIHLTTSKKSLQIGKLIFEARKTSWSRIQMVFAVDLDTKEVEIDSMLCDAIQTVVVLHCLRYHVD